MDSKASGGDEDRPQAIKHDAPPFPGPDSSTVQLCGFGGSSCGYCHSSSSSSSVAYGLVSSRMLIQDYCQLLLAGWRRSGTYFYKPVNHVTCCPAYTIRLKIADFKPSKPQRQIVRRLERFLLTGDVHHKTDIATSLQAGTHRQKATDNTSSSPGVEAHVLSVGLVQAEYTEERFELYKKYQHVVHKDELEEVTPKGFTRFLVQSPLVLPSTSSAASSSSSSSSEKFGTYHQLYRLDGKLVAVGVVDLLPIGFSSVYFFYDPDQKHLVLGKYSALQEISFCQENGIEFYFMGFYIHTCEKMRYKAEFSPSELLCPTTHKWFPFSQCLSALNAHSFTPFDPILIPRRASIPPEQSSLQAVAAAPKASSPKTQLPVPSSRKSHAAQENTGSARSEKAQKVVTHKGKKREHKDSTIKESSDGDESMDEEEGKDDEEGEVIVEIDWRKVVRTSPLAVLGPIFPQVNRQDYATIPLDLGFGVPLFVSQLKPRGQEIVNMMLDDLCTMCGFDIARKMCVKLS